MFYCLVTSDMLSLKKLGYSSALRLLRLNVLAVCIYFFPFCSYEWIRLMLVWLCIDCKPNPIGIRKCSFSQRKITEKHQRKSCETLSRVESRLSCNLGTYEQ